MVYMGEENEPVLLVRRTKENAYIVKRHRGARRIVKISDFMFSKYYKLTNHHPAIVAETWLNGPIKMTEEVKRELKMQIFIHRNKIVAKVEAGQETPEGIHEDAKIYTREDLEGLTMKQLVKLFNTGLDKDSKVTVIPDVEGDIAEAQAAVWNTLAETPVAVKGAKKASTPRAEKSYEFVAEIAEGTTMPVQARVIVATLQDAGKALTKSELVAELVEAGQLVTNQPVERIVAFYQKRLVEEGYITMS